MSSDARNFFKCFLLGVFLCVERDVRRLIETT